MTRLQGGDWGDIMMIPAVDRAELQNYFISYGSLGDMNKEIKYAVNQSYQKKVYGVASVGNAPASSTTRGSSRRPASTSCRPPRRNSSPT